MTELEKIEYAKSYIDKLANGINPLTGQPVADADIVNNVRISRCLFYVSDILRQTIESRGISSVKKKQKKLTFYIDHDQRAKFEYSDKPIPVSEITRRINALIDEDNMLKLKHTSITSWLMDIGLLIELVQTDERIFKQPTQQGNVLGITIEIRHGMTKDYSVTVYNRAAQQFVLDNLDAVIEKQLQQKQSKEN